MTEKTGAPSFTKAFLAQHEHPIAQLINDVRRLDKLKETFVKGVVLEGNYKGRIHCQFNQLRSDEGGTVTGRFSSSQPNLQQIPIRGEDGKPIRTMFISEQSQRWHKLDYNQVEFRLLVNDAFELDRRGLCECPGAQEVVEKFNTDPNTDYHQLVAEMIERDRTIAKGVNFGLIYGEGIARLCHDLGISREEGEELLRKYHEQRAVHAAADGPLQGSGKEQERSANPVWAAQAFQPMGHQGRQDHRKRQATSQLQAGLHLYRPERQDPGQRRRHHEDRHGQDLGERRLRRGRSAAPDGA